MPLQPQLIVVGGFAGSGKSRLMRSQPRNHRNEFHSLTLTAQ